VTSAARVEAEVREVWRDRPALRWNASATAREVVERLGWPAARLRSVRREVARLAKLASGERLNLEVEEEVGEMPKGTPKTRNADDLTGLIGRDVECRCAGGGCYRGTLRAIGNDFVRIERATTSRAVYVRRSGLVALVDETAPGLAAVGRRTAEEQADSEVGQ
jgi:hypothetical protein